MLKHSRIGMTLATATLFALTVSASSANAGIIVNNPDLSPGDLVAYFPLTDGTNGSTVTGADDIIDDGTHPITDASLVGSGDTWVYDATRDRIVLSTGEGAYYSAGTQGADRTSGFSWSFWANIASSNIADSNADGVIGTRSGFSGSWNKIDLTSTSSWAGISYATLADDSWHHFAYVGDATSVRLYKDGVLLGSDTTTPFALFNGAFNFGGVASFSERVTGLYSDIAIWDSALTTGQIALLAGGAEVQISVPTPAALPAGLALIGLVATRRRRRRRS